MAYGLKASSSHPLRTLIVTTKVILDHFLAKYNVLTVADMHALELGTLMYRNSVNKLLSSFNDYFTKRSEVHN